MGDRSRRRNLENGYEKQSRVGMGTGEEDAESCPGFS